MEKQSMGELICARRKERGMTQKELALQMHVTDKAVSKWERDRSCPDVKLLGQLAQVLEIPVEQLLQSAQGAAAPVPQGELPHKILAAIPLAMGVATVVLQLLGRLDGDAAPALLGIGVACLGALQLIKE